MKSTRERAPDCVMDSISSTHGLHNAVTQWESSQSDSGRYLAQNTENFAALTNSDPGRLDGDEEKEMNSLPNRHSKENYISENLRLEKRYYYLMNFLTVYCSGRYQFKSLDIGECQDYVLPCPEFNELYMLSFHAKNQALIQGIRMLEGLVVSKLAMRGLCTAVESAGRGVDTSTTTTKDTARRGDDAGEPPQPPSTDRRVDSRVAHNSSYPSARMPRGIQTNKHYPAAQNGVGAVADRADTGARPDAPTKSVKGGVPQNTPGKALGDSQLTANTEYFMEKTLEDHEFKGVIVNFAYVDDEPKSVNFMKDSKFIDMSTTGFYETEKEEKANGDKFCSVKMLEAIYFKILHKVKINCVDCLEIEKVDFTLEHEKHFVKIEDVVIIDNFEVIAKYHNQVIIIPQSIVKYEFLEDTDFKLKELIRFTDSKDKSFQGTLVWIGKVNDIKAGLVILSEEEKDEDLEKITIHTKTLENPVCELEGNAVFVGRFALNKDVICYITCNTTELQVVDPKFEHHFKTKDFREKLLLFNFKEKRYAMKLKWKGLIYNQLCVGCEMNKKSDEGSDGSYGSVRLFSCSPKRGVIITAKKVNSLNIKDLCELSGHRELQTHSIIGGVSIYNKKSICCVENMDTIENYQGLKIGCKILCGNEFIGVCKFVGKVNGELSVGVKMNEKFVYENQSVLDAINEYGFQGGKYEFLSIDSITVGSFYKQSMSNFSSNDFKEVHYFPKNKRTCQSERATVKWSGYHDNGEYVYGMELTKKVEDHYSEYFFEDRLFEHEKFHGLIDATYTTEEVMCTSYMESETAQNSDKETILRKIIHHFLKPEEPKRLSDIAEDLMNYFQKEFIQIIIDKDQSALRREDFPKIIRVLYENGKISEIDKLFAAFEMTNEIFPSLLNQLLTIVAEGDHISLVHTILNKLKISDKEDGNNIACLQLSVKCLETIKTINETCNIRSLFESLIEKCNNINIMITYPDKRGETFLTDIISNDGINEEVVGYVLSLNKFDINSGNSSEETPIRIAFKKKKTEILQKLLELEIKDEDLRQLLDEHHRDAQYKECCHLVLMHRFTKGTESESSSTMESINSNQ